MFLPNPIAITTGDRCRGAMLKRDVSSGTWSTLNIFFTSAAVAVR